MNTLTAAEAEMRRARVAMMLHYDAWLEAYKAGTVSRVEFAYELHTMHRMPLDAIEAHLAGLDNGGNFL